MEKPNNKQNTGNAGEYYVAALLSASNFVTTITLGRAERYDILAVAPNGKTFKFSVKTRISGEHTNFTLSKKDERVEKDLFYVLVRLHNFKQEPEYWVIPSKRVSEVISSAHKKWVKTPGKKGQPHNDNDLRKIPIILRGADKAHYYSVDWEEEMKNYYKKDFRLL